MLSFFAGTFVQAQEAPKDDKKNEEFKSQPYLIIVMVKV